MPRKRLVAAALVACVLAPAAAAHASATQVSIMQDDDQLVYRDDATRDRALDEMKALGVDVVRATVLWRNVAVGVSRSAAARKDLASPRAYGVAVWNRYDNLVRAAQARGLRVYFSVTGPPPDWAHARAPRRERDAVRLAWEPDPRKFAKFVVAVGRRYSGHYRDEDSGRSLLPRVDFWGLWNEPNQAGWLAPQNAFSREAGRVIPVAPIMYRELFLRELLCVDARGHSFRGRQARARHCSDFDKFGPLRASAYGHHPYTKDLAPTQRDASPDSITMADISNLGVLIDRYSRTGRIAKGLPIVLSEFGYETNPPDPFSGQPLDRQAEYINEGDYLAAQNPRILSQTQFILRDAGPVLRARPGTKPYWFTYQSGLLFADGSPKPAAAAYALPFIARPTAGGVGVWGQLRFRPNGIVDQVQIERLSDDGTTWEPVGAPVEVINPVGMFQTVLDGADRKSVV